MSVWPARALVVPTGPQLGHQWPSPESISEGVGRNSGMLVALISGGSPAPALDSSSLPLFPPYGDVCES